MPWQSRRPPRRRAAHALLVGLAIAPTASAADIDTSLGGFVKLQFGAFDPGAPPHGADGARIDGEAHLSVSGQTDTGITYGLRLQLLRAAKPRDDGTFIEAGWAWGEFRLGDYGGAAKELGVSAPTVGIGQIDGDFDRFGAPSTLLVPYKLDNDDSTRLTYLSPAILGLRLGLSFAPELAGGGIEPVPGRTLSGIDRHRDVTEIALQSARDIGDATVTVSGTYVAGAAAAGSHLHDLNGASAGVRVAWNAFTAGIGFVHDGAATLPVDPRPGHVGVETITDEVNAGLTYDLGRWRLGASWAHDARASRPATDMASAGAVYRIVRGVSVAADLARYDRLSATATRRTNALILETAVHF